MSRAPGRGQPSPQHHAGEERARQYLNQALMDGLDERAFQARHPFPWVNPQGFIEPDAYRELLDSMPALERFTPSFGEQRKSDQASHDRYILDYERGMALPGPWARFIAELLGESYRAFVCRLLGVRRVRLRLHWHYAPNGSEVGPHCDSRIKLGSQIFYLNTWDDWHPDWGGETVILDDAGRFPTYSAPRFEDFDAEWPARTMDNRCIIFGRRGNSWHGVKRIDCPEDRHRKVFIVVFVEHRPLRALYKKLRRALAGKPLLNEKERLTF